MLKVEGAFSRLRCAVTSNLTNMPHRDLDDAGKCFAIWVRKHVSAPPPKEWWLLFPSVGLAIQLHHGVRISWNGRCAPHCSISVPGEGDELLSLFAGTSHRVQAHREAWADFQLKRRAQRRKELQVGDEVRVEMLGGTSMCARHETRLARGKVTQVHQDGGAQVLVMGCSSPWKVVLPREQVVILRRPCA